MIPNEPKILVEGPVPVVLITAEVLPFWLVKLLTVNGEVDAVPTLMVAQPSEAEIIDELVPPDRVVVVELMVKPCPDVALTLLFTLFNNVTVSPAELMVRPAVLPLLVVPFNAIEPLLFKVRP